MSICRISVRRCKYCRGRLWWWWWDAEWDSAAFAADDEAFALPRDGAVDPAAAAVDDDDDDAGSGGDAVEGSPPAGTVKRDLRACGASDSIMVNFKYISLELQYQFCTSTTSRCISRSCVGRTVALLILGTIVSELGDRAGVHFSGQLATTTEREREGLGARRNCVAFLFFRTPAVK